MTMTPALTAAAERLISLPGFRWMPGMADRYENRALIAYDDGTFHVWDGGCAFHCTAMSLPDLNDPATLGCVEQMVCDALDDPGFTVSGYYQYEGSYVFRADPGCISEFAAALELQWFDTRAECLVNALAAAAGAA